MASTCVEWEAVHALLFDNLKREPTHFYGRRECDQTIAVRVTMLDGNIIQAEEVQKWLGILNFKYHVKSKAASALRAFTGISRLASTEQGLSYQAPHQLFQTCVATISDFGAEVWWNGQIGLSNIIQ